MELVAKSRWCLLLAIGLVGILPSPFDGYACAEDLYLNNARVSGWMRANRRKQKLLLTVTGTDRDSKARVEIKLRVRGKEFPGVMSQKYAVFVDFVSSSRRDISGRIVSPNVIDVRSKFLRWSFGKIRMKRRLSGTKRGKQRIRGRTSLIVEIVEPATGVEVPFLKAPPGYTFFLRT